MPESSSQPERLPLPAPSSDNQVQLVLVKHGQRFVFRYEPGEEQILLEQMLAMARDPGSNFTPFDAAVLSHQMGRQWSEHLKHLNKAS